MMNCQCLRVSTSFWNWITESEKYHIGGTESRLRKANAVLKQKTEFSYCSSHINLPFDSLGGNSLPWSHTYLPFMLYVGLGLIRHQFYVISSLSLRWPFKTRISKIFPLKLSFIHPYPRYLFIIDCFHSFNKPIILSTARVLLWRAVFALATKSWHFNHQEMNC